MSLKFQKYTNLHQTFQMIDESIKIKLNQFMLAYERQSAQLEFQKQNIKQNVMLTIIQNKSAKKNNISIINNSLEKSMTKSKTNQNLASSKQTKFSQQKQTTDKKYNENQEHDNCFEQMQQSKLDFKSNSRLLERSNISIKQNKCNLLKNNYLNQQQDNDEQELIKKQSISGFYNNSYLKTGNHAIEVQNQSRISQKRQKQQFEQAYPEQKDIMSENFNKKSMVGSKVYPNSQKAIKQNNPSILKQINPSFIKQNQYGEQLENYPTFKKPSFQFITNLSQLRQSNPNQQNDQQEDRQNSLEQQYDPQLQSYAQDEKQNLPHKKWNTNRRNNDWNQEQDNNQNAQEQEGQQIFQNNQSNVISNIQEDQSMILNSNFKQKPKLPEPSRKSYMAFQINMEKSNLPNNQNLEELKKKKILQLQRKRIQRIQNNSKRKINPSQINTPNQKQQKQLQKQYSNVFIDSNRQNSRKQHDNRDSLNKSINERKQQRTKNLKNSGYRQEQSSNRDSMFQDNHTIITKYGQDSKINNNTRSPSPLNTIKTVHTTDKRPPLNKNKRQQNIFAGDSGFQRNQGESGYQKQRSIHKVSDPKIVPIDRKNSFQKKSNIKLMINAITYTCLPGQLNRKQREKLIDILDDYESEFFIFLFKEYSRKVIKGIYVLQNGQDRIMKIYGEKAPVEIFAEQVHQFYRFDSGSRQFKKIDGCKSFSFSVHAVDLK